MLQYIWHHFLYLPLLNVLLLLYNEFSMNNMVIAVILLTILVRVILLPFSLVVERNKSKFEKINEDIENIPESYIRGTFEWNEKVRIILRENRITPWAKMVLLIAQLGILFLLYHVFIDGIHIRSEFLYSWVSAPGVINSELGSLDIAKRNINLSALVAGILFVKIILEQLNRRKYLQESDVIYRFLFPLGTFLLLAFLPSVKALFVLVSMGCTTLFHYTKIMIDLIVSSLKEKKLEGTDIKNQDGMDYSSKGFSNPWDALRKKA